MDDDNSFPVRSGERLLIPREYVDGIYDEDPDPPPKTSPPKVGRFQFVLVTNGGLKP
ncbi:hypothetical protein [Pleomorphomonas oryzae]|uniref:hypothetical protein n=1 Tax=Pleomorphomonas oryzae TaxID=261934 RepID=UPI0012EB21AC|nr:hypothetical protein [Pleomorphomonas oryzae]